MNIPTELEVPTSVRAENCGLLVYSSNNMVESLNNAVTGNVFCNTYTPTGVRGTENNNKYNSLLTTPLNNHICIRQRQFIIQYQKTCCDIR